MSAMSGSDSDMRMYSLLSNGKNFEDAFENIYEISWNDAKPIFSEYVSCLLYTSPSPRDRQKSRMPSSA